MNINKIKADYILRKNIFLYNQFFYEVKDLQGFQKQLQEQKAELHFWFRQGRFFQKKENVKSKQNP